MEKGLLVSFNVICDDSDWASNCFGVEAENDWFDVQFYAENLFGEIVKKNTIERIDKEGNKTGIFYKITDGVIKSEINKLLYGKSKYDLKLLDIFEGSGLKTFNDFKEIKVINYIKLNSKRDFSKPDEYKYLDRIYMCGKIFIQEPC